MKKEQKTRLVEVDRIAERAHEVVDGAHEQVKNVAAGATELADQAGDRLGDAVASVGRVLRSVAKGLREPPDARALLVAPRQRIANRLEKAATYLERRSVSDDDRRATVRDGFVALLLVTASSAGYFVGRSLISRVLRR
ncbi:MAG TPA: hypothetical protein VMS22_21360 [Candidatus Eisenbacteria bacterium]|nr:hypothetical protein [Candidatus Eisenbacteria bacterium]